MTFKRLFLTGLAAILPLLVTLFLLYTLFEYVDRVTQPITDWFLVSIGADHLRRPFPVLIWVGGVVFYLVIMTVLIYLIGRVVASYVGGVLFQWFENVFLKFPVVRAIYPYARQVTDFFLSEKTMKFTKVVALEYPRKGVYSIGFLTGDSFTEVQKAGGKKIVNVFVPSSPTPFTGYVVLVPEEELIRLSITVDEVIRHIISGGVITPSRGKALPPVQGGVPFPQPAQPDAPANVKTP